MKNALNTMAGRVFLILVAGVLASALLTNFLSRQERQMVVGELRGAHAADRIVQLVQTLDALPPQDRRLALAGASSAYLSADFSDNAAQRHGTADPAMTEALQQRLGMERRIRAEKDVSNCPVPDFTPPPHHRLDRPPTCRAIHLELRDGTPLHLLVRLPPPPPGPLESPGGFIWLGFFLACIAALAWIVARMATRPLRSLAEAAKELGRDIDRPPLTLAGPQEVRHAAAAFNAMQERIHHYVGERLRMLAAITHDLQTPLTRLRLRLEKVEDGELRDRLVGDLAAMQAMIKEGLDLVRSLEGPLPLAPLELSSLVDSLCEDAAEAGQDVALDEAQRPTVIVAAHADSLRRCLTNLIDNAVKYGGRARVSLVREGQRIRISVRDAGPGIPAEQLEAVFEPFARLENSRSRDTGGTGLGLTISREIARRHGGSLRLVNQPEGLEALLELPAMP